MPCDDYEVYPGTPSKCTCSFFDIWIPIRRDPSTQPSASPAPSATPSQSPSISLLPSTGPSLYPSASSSPTDHPTISVSPSTTSPTVTMVPSSPPSCVNLGSFDCKAFAFDAFDTINYSIITKEDTVSAAKNVYKKMYVGGNLSNPGSNTVTVGGHVYYGSITEPIGINFNGGKTKLSDLSNPSLDFKYYEWLATHIDAGSFGNGYEVAIVTQPKGSCYNMYDFLGTAAQGSNNGKTLVVFTFEDDICLTKTPDGRQFGPSVLAPFSKVTLTNAGYLDGIVIAKTFTTVMNGSNGSEQQLHGVAYDG